MSWGAAKAGVVVLWLGGAGAALLAGCGSAQGDLSLNTGLSASVSPPPPPPPASSPAPAPTPVATPAPPPSNGVAVIVGDQIQVNQRILYDTDKDQIAPESFPVLDEVANILNSHPEIVRMTVEGHTDNQGTVEYNIKLSERRANAVVAYLAGRGVRQPMRAPGYGAAAPVCFQDTDDCRAQNRRVVFKIETQK
jgi:peptidoglycan-associated lipoprotein